MQVHGNFGSLTRFMLRSLILVTTLLFSMIMHAQEGPAKGVLMGNVTDDKKKALEAATVELMGLNNPAYRLTVQTDKTGEFGFSGIPYGYYRLSISFIGWQTLRMDSIHFREERYDFNMADISLVAGTSTNMETVVLYAEKPLVQSKDGNIT